MKSSVLNVCNTLEILFDDEFKESHTTVQFSSVASRSKREQMIQSAGKKNKLKDREVNKLMPEPLCRFRLNLSLK